MRMEAQTPPIELREDLIAERAEELIDAPQLWSKPSKRARA